MNTMNIPAIESLSAFAFAHGELQFVQLCTAALQGEAWAVERLTAAIDEALANNPSWHLADAAPHLIATVDTARPDGAIARGGFQP